MSLVWPGALVSEDNPKTRVSAFRKALGADRNMIRTEFGRGYRFIGVLRMNAVTAAVISAQMSALVAERQFGSCTER